jgi:hypothetical protein
MMKASDVIDSLLFISTLIDRGDNMGICGSRWVGKQMPQQDD